MTAPTIAPPFVLDPDVMAAAAIVAGGPADGCSDRAKALAATAIEVADRDVMDDIVEAIQADYTPSGNTGPRVSDAGSCRRSVWYRESPPEGFVPDPRQYLRQAALGTIIHKKAEEVRSARYPWRHYEFEVPVPGLDKMARIDEYDPILGEVIDDKTAGSRKWDVVGNDGPAESAWAQGFIYGLAIEELGLPVQAVRVIVINRDNGDEEHFRRDYDPTIARRFLDGLVELATMLDLGVVPPRDGTGPGTDWQCRSCTARSHCWNLDAAAAAGRTPESFTLLGEEPTDETIVWAAENLIAARSRLRDAKQAEEIAKELVQGVEPGTYGGYEFSATRRHMPNYKESFERLVELYALPEVHRPPVGDVDKPLMRVDRYTSVKRVRAAKRAKAAKAVAK